MEKNTTKNSQKFSKILKNFYCKNCDYTCTRKSDYNKHLKSIKHNTTNTTKYNKIQHKILKCICGKEYSHRASLYNHKKSCIQVDREENAVVSRSDEIDYKELLMKVIEQQHQQNNEVLTKLIDNITKKDDMMLDMSNKIGNTTNNNNNTNNLNINMFLNEQCKGAVNFSEFIEGIEVTREDLENNAQLGFVNGVSKILSDNLNQLTLYERPIHCTDMKRYTLYIKDDNMWEKSQSIRKLENAIMTVSRKSVSSLLDWKRTNPDYQDMDSDFSNRCIAMQQESIAGLNRDVYYPKVIHNLANSNMIDKKTAMK